jgi:hypothetical protein
MEQSFLAGIEESGQLCLPGKEPCLTFSASTAGVLSRRRSEASAFVETTADKMAGLLNS